VNVLRSPAKLAFATNDLSMAMKTNHSSRQQGHRSDSAGMARGSKK